MEFLKWLANTFDKFGSELNINRIPLYHFSILWLECWVGGVDSVGVFWGW